MTARSRLRVLCLPTGPDEYAAAVVRALASKVDVDFVLPVPMLERYGDDLPPSVRVHPLRWPRHRDPRNLVLLAQIARIIHATAPDLIHFLGESVVWLTLGLPYFRRLPLVVTVHDVVFHPGDSESRTVPMTTIRHLRRAADAIIVHGHTLRRDLLATGVTPHAGIQVVPHPVLDRHARIAQRLGLIRRSDSSVQTLLFFGRIMAYKGLGLLIEASDLVVLRQPHVRFVVAGRGPDLQNWRNAMERRPWFQVHEGFISDADTAQYFLDADIAVLPYTEASQSGVVAIAAGFCLPVVATSVGELGTLLTSTGIGPVVEPTAANLAEALIGLLASPDRLSEYRAHTAAAARTVLSANYVAAQTIKIYSHTIKCKMRPSSIKHPTRRAQV